MQTLKACACIYAFSCMWCHGFSLYMQYNLIYCIFFIEQSIVVMFCNQCGCSLIINSKFCHICGKESSPSTALSVNSTSKSSTSPTTTTTMGSSALTTPIQPVSCSGVAMARQTGQIDVLSN